MQFCFSPVLHWLMAVPVNHRLEMKSFDGLVAPNLEWRHLEVSQHSYSVSCSSINLPTSSVLCEGVSVLRQAGALRLALTGVGPLQEFIRGLLRPLTSCSPFSAADESLTRTAAISILTLNSAPLGPALSPGQFGCFWSDSERDSTWRWSRCGRDEQHDDSFWWRGGRTAFWAKRNNQINMHDWESRRGSAALRGIDDQQVVRSNKVAMMKERWQKWSTLQPQWVHVGVCGCENIYPIEHAYIQPQLLPLLTTMGHHWNVYIVLLDLDNADTPWFFLSGVTLVFSRRVYGFDSEGDSLMRRSWQRSHRHDLWS